MNWLNQITLVSIALFTSSISFGQNSTVPPPKEDFLVIQGIVVDDETTLEGVTIRLFKGNSKIDSVYTGKNGAFQFSLGKEYYYAMEFSRVGYENTCVLINTNRWDVDPQNEDNGYQVVFEVELINEIPNKSSLALTAEDYDVLDFPKVMIGYKAGEDEGFVSDKIYMKSVKESLKKIKNTAKAK